MALESDVQDGVERAVRRNASILTAFVAGLVVLALVLLVTAGDAQSLVGATGVAMVAVAGVLATVDAWHPLPRPRPRAEVAGVVVPASQLPGLTMVLGAGGLVVMVTGFVLGDGLLAVAGERRGGLWLVIAAAASPVLLAWAIWIAARPDLLRLDAAGVAARRLGRTSHVPWEQLDAVELVAANPGRVLRLHRSDGRAVLLTTRYLQPSTTDRILALLEYLRDPPPGDPPLEPSDVLDRLDARGVATS